MNSWIGEHPTVSFRILGELFRSGDDRIARALADHSGKTIRESKCYHPSLALVDHGTPLREVNQVREQVGDELEKLMSSEISDFSTCSMERRKERNTTSMIRYWKASLRNGLKIKIRIFRFLLPLYFFHQGGMQEGGEIWQNAGDRSAKVQIMRSLGNHPLILMLIVFIVPIIHFRM